MGFEFEFINGPLDGKLVSGESEEPRDARLARFLNIATGGGSVGRWFRGLTPELLSEKERRRVDVRELNRIEFEVANRNGNNGRVTVHLRQRL